MNRFDTLAAHLDQAAARLPATASRAANQIMGDVYDDLTLNSPVGEDGHYAEAWRKFDVLDGAGVGNDHPEGPSLEFGSYGTDSLGRVRNNPAQPHLRPAVAAAKPRERLAKAIIDELG